MTPDWGTRSSEGNRGNQPMEFDLTESVVRGFLRDHSGRAHCAECVARALVERVPRRVISTIMSELSERRPFLKGRCGCGAEGLVFRLRR